MIYIFILFFILFYFILIIILSIFILFIINSGNLKESNECMELIKNEVKKDNEEINIEDTHNDIDSEQENDLSSTPTTSKKNKKVSYSVNNQLMLNER